MVSLLYSHLASVGCSLLVHAYLFSLSPSPSLTYHSYGKLPFFSLFSLFLSFSLRSCKTKTLAPFKSRQTIMQARQTFVEIIIERSGHAMRLSHCLRLCDGRG